MISSPKRMRVDDPWGRLRADVDRLWWRVDEQRAVGGCSVGGGPVGGRPVLEPMPSRGPVCGGGAEGRWHDLSISTSAEQFAQVDPTRVYTGEDLAFFGATIYRSLTVYKYRHGSGGRRPPSSPTSRRTLGTVADGAKTWSFTLRDGVTFQDGSPITCKDVAYGTSRDVRPGSPHVGSDVRDPVPRHPERPQGRVRVQGAVHQDRPGPLRQGGHLLRRQQDDHVPPEAPRPGLQLHGDPRLRAGPAGRRQGREVRHGHQRRSRPART